MKIFLACNFPRDDRLGSARTPLRLEPELERLGVRVRSGYSDELPQAPPGRAGSLSGPLRMAWAARRLAVDADIVDIAGGEGFAYFRYARLRRPEQALVARSNGLWDLALSGDDPSLRSPFKRQMSDLYQKHTLCRFEQSSIRAADMAVFLSRCDADEVVKRGWRTAEGVAAVNPGVDSFFEAGNPLEARRDIAFVGTFFHRKGSDVVVKAVSRLLAERPTLGLTVFGAGMPEAAVLAQFDASVRGRVTVVASVSAAELGKRLAAFAIFLFPTRYEGFGIVLLEAMRAGLGVVTTPTGAGADLVRDGTNGLLVPFGDANATHAAVTRLLDDPSLLARVGLRAAEDARGRTWSRAAEQLVAVYELALHRAGGRQKGR